MVSLVDLRKAVDVATILLVLLLLHFNLATIERISDGDL